MPKETKLNPWELRSGERVEDLDCRIALTQDSIGFLLIAAYPDGTGWVEAVSVKDRATPV
jgi:hypothetical protein